MDLITFQSIIKKNELDKMYIFTGKDIGIMNVYIQKISEMKKLKIKRIDSYESIKQSLRMQSFFNDNTLYVIYNDKSIFNIDLEEIQSNDFLVFRFDKIDNRKKFFIKNEERIIIFNNMHENVLLSHCNKYIDKRYNNHILKLINYCDKDYSRLMNEIDKIKQLSNVLDITTGEALKYLLNGYIYKKPEDVIFILIDAIMKKDLSSFDLLKESLDSGEFILTIIKVLVNNAWALLAYKGCNLNIQKNTGLNYAQIKSCENWDNKWTVKKLLSLIRIIRFVEIGIKTGKVNDSQGIKYIILEALL